MPASSPVAERWRLQRRTLAAMALLIVARLMIAIVPLRFWRGSLGGRPGARADLRESRVLAAHVERGAARLPFELKCLPRAMTLSMLLRRAGLAHRVVFAVRPRGQRKGEDRLHAWVEQDGVLLIGDLPGPWIEILRLGNVPE